MLFLIMGATYAYYFVSVEGSSTTSKINIQVGELNSIVLRGLISELYLDVGIEDMSLSKVGSYYSTDTKENKYNTEPIEYQIAELGIVGNITERNKCTGSIKVEMDTSPNSMGEALMSDDAYLYIKSAGVLIDKLDLSNLKEENTKIYDIEFLITDKTPQYIEAYMELKNKETGQNYIAGKELNVKITIDSFKCKGDSEAPTITKFYVNNENQQPKYTNNSNITAYLEWKDDDATEYCVTSEKDNCSWLNVSEEERRNKKLQLSKTLVGTGEQALYAYLKDEVGNESQPKSDTIIIDTTKPVIKEFTIGSTYINTTTLPITLTSNDNDIKEWCVIDVNDVTKCTSWQSYTNAAKNIIISGNEGTKTYYAFLKDNAGNTSNVSGNTATNNASVIYDKTAPTIGTSTKATTITETSATITVVVDDIKGTGADVTSGIKEYCYSMNATSGYKCNNYSTTKTFTIDKDASNAALKAGTQYTYYVYAVDNAGNGTMENRVTLKFTTNKKASDLVIDNATGQIQSEPVEGDTLRRFQGDASNVKNNYICFGTSDQNTCTTNQATYMYRIIGVDINTNQLKIIKKEALDTAYKWHSTNSNTWNNSMLYKQLNGIDTGDSSYLSDIFLSNTTYVPNIKIPNTNITWSNAIETHKWNYGVFSSGYDDTALNVLKVEQKVWAGGDGYPYYARTVDAKIGLMYLSDYYLAVSNNENCFSNYSTCKASWIYLSNNDAGNPGRDQEWTMLCEGNINAWLVMDNGRVGTYAVYFDALAVRPVFYLIPNIKLEGNGSIGNPYRIIGLVQ